jgi:hypothetical protein
MTRPDPVAGIRIDDLGDLLRKRERRIIVIMACFAILLLTGAGCGTYIFVVQNQRISDNKQNAATAKIRADVAANVAKITKAQAREANLRSTRVLKCLTKEPEPAKCLDIAAGQPGKDGGIGADGRPGRQGIEGQPGQQGSPGKTGATGADGKPGAPGRAPTAAEIEGAVTAYCSTHGDCAGPPGENTAVSPSQVASAVQAYCDSRGQCKGADGKDGKNGADSTVPGPAGPAGQDAPPPTQEQVNAAVAAYCAGNPAACQAPAPVPPATP